MKNEIERMVNYMRKMKTIIFAVLFSIMFVAICGGFSQTIQAKSVVEKRLEAVRKEFPQNSVIHASVNVNGTSGSGCNAIVMYATNKIFHNAYDPKENTFRQIGQTTSTKNIVKMKKLFKKAKVGDVIRWRQGYTDRHFAIYLSSNEQGVYLYESNFKTKNKVWYKHFWAWKYMKTWPTGGADKVNVYRSKNYEKVNSGEAAKNYAVNSKFTVNGIVYQVLKTEPLGGRVKVISFEDESTDKKIPKQLFVNRTEDGCNSNEESYGVYSAKKRNISEQLTYEVLQ